MYITCVQNLRLFVTHLLPVLEVRSRRQSGSSRPGYAGNKKRLGKDGWK